MRVVYCYFSQITSVFFKVNMPFLIKQYQCNRDQKRYCKSHNIMFLFKIHLTLSLLIKKTDGNRKNKND